MSWINYWQDKTGLWPFLIQYRSPTTGLFQPPGLGAPGTPQVDKDFCNERRCDYFPTAGPLGQQHCDCVLETSQGGMFAIQYLSFPPWRSQIVVQGDGGNLVGVTEDGFIKGFATTDGSKPGKLYYFIGPEGPNGWIMGGTDAILSVPKWIEHICMIQQSYPGPNNPEGILTPAYTRYTRQIVSVPVWFDGANPEVDNYDCMISEHYDNPTPESSTAFERFVLGYGWGLIRWEAWARVGIPSPHLNERAPTMAYCYDPNNPTAGVPSGFKLMDARHYMNLHLEDPWDTLNRFHVGGANWPGEVLLP